MSGSTSWRERIRAQRYLSVRVGKADRDRGVVCVQGAAGVAFAPWDVPSGSLVPPEIGTDGFAASAWLAADGRAVFRLADRGGDERGHVERVAIDGAGGGPIDLTPELAPYSLRGGDSSLDGTTVVFAAVNAEGFHLVAAPSDGDAPCRIVYRSDNEAWQARVSADASLASIDTTDHNPGVRRFGVSVFDLRTGDRVGTLTDPGGGSVTGVCFATTPGDPTLLVDVAAEPGGISRPMLWHPVTGELAVVPTPWEDDDVETVGLDWSPDGTRLLLGVQRHAAQRLAVHDLARGTTDSVDLPPGCFWLPHVYGSAFGAGGAVLASTEDSATSLRVLCADRDGNVRAVLPAPPAPPGHPARSVTFPSADGTKVQAWLVRPDEAGPHPTIVHVHGGPHVFSPDAYNPETQAWVDHGFNLLEVNYRGSTGRGSAFAQQIWGRVGELELQDIAAAHAFAVDSGIARPHAVFLAGESYGGFLTLLGLGRQPDLWAGGFAMVAVADWTAAYAEAAAALQAAFRTWFGGTPDELSEEYRRSSPITYVADLKAPVVVLQGTNDSRTPPKQMRAYEQQAGELGKDVTVLWFESGHGFGGTTLSEWALEIFTAAATRHGR